MIGNLKLTTKMQLAILGVLLGVGALVMIIIFVVLPMARERRASVARSLEIRAKIEIQERKIKKSRELRNQLDDVQAQIESLAEHMPLPVLGNLLLGMEKQVHACAQELDLVIEQVSSQDVLELAGTPFRIYRVRVTALAGYDALLNYLQALHQSNPLLSVSGLTIKARPNKPQAHEVALTLAWLIWADPAKRPEFLIKSSVPIAKGENAELVTVPQPATPSGGQGIDVKSSQPEVAGGTEP